MRHLDKAMEEAFNQPINRLALTEPVKSDYRKPMLQEVCDWLWNEKGICVTSPRISDSDSCYECAIQFIDESGKEELPIKGSGGTRDNAINDALYIVLSCLNEPIEPESKPTLCERIGRWLDWPLIPDERQWRSLRLPCKVLQGSGRVPTRND